MNIRNVLKFCVKNDFHLNEFIILFLNNKDDKVLEAYLNKFSFENKFTGVKTSELVERGYLNKLEESDGTVSYSTTGAFHKLFAAEDRFIMDIYEPYPGFVTTDNGKRLAIKGGTEHELSKLYLASIGNSLEEHEEVVLDLDYAIKNNLITYSIKNFVSGYYKEIRKLREKGGSLSVISMDYD